jgi:histidinol phosphatase-like PHP family hydrolase
MADINANIASLLLDMASVQRKTQSQWGYKRAAATVLNLGEPIEAYRLPDRTLRKIPTIGPSSTRVILEVLETGGSPTVERAIAESGKAPEIERSRRLRTHFLSRAEVVAALSDPRLRGPRLGEYRGDLQMHSTYSDGGDSLDVIVEACAERGYSYAAVTDHSYGLPIAGGVTLADLQRQHREIDDLNRRYAGRFKLLKGIEANVLGDGTLDMSAGEAAQLDIVVASPHSALRSSADQTGRLVAAVSLPGVHILGHPRGRKFGARPGIMANWDEVFSTAAARRVAVEIDGDPSRQDLDFDLARRALAAGCLFALDSDAHSTGQLRYAETAIAHARLAGIPKERVINCWPLDELLDWANTLRR